MEKWNPINRIVGDSTFPSLIFTFSRIIGLNEVKHKIQWFVGDCENRLKEACLSNS
ncbi:hypothetical protein [Candidatus Lokiarchaeum ossiferum]|uniref:hypothetical protein n=1 Tax=Candidatus Lokiarchaeum ossiferum TaxID=2951803 RepID=UPI00352E6D09